MAENPDEANDTWDEFEDMDLHMFFDEPDYPEEEGVFAYPLVKDNLGITQFTDTSEGIKILDGEKKPVYEEF